MDSAYIVNADRGDKTRVVPENTFVEAICVSCARILIRIGFAVTEFNAATIVLIRQGVSVGPLRIAQRAEAAEV